MKCIFCAMLEKRPPEFEMREFVARLDIHPVSPGHLLIIPKRHITCLRDLNLQEFSELIRMLKLAEEYLKPGRRRVIWTIYTQLIEEQITPNSPWFIKKALVHPRFGTTPDGFNHIVNEGEAAGQTVGHLHWHVIPRYRGDVHDPSGGGRYVIPAMGNYKNPRV